MLCDVEPLKRHRQNNKESAIDSDLRRTLLSHISNDIIRLPYERLLLPLALDSSIIVHLIFEIQMVASSGRSAL
jgi:hypothetical protein